MGQVRSAMALLGRVVVATAEMAGATTEAAAGVAKAVRRTQAGSACAAAGSMAAAVPARAAHGAGATAGFCRATVVSGLSLAATARDAGGMVLSEAGRAGGRSLMRLGRSGRGLTHVPVEPHPQQLLRTQPTCARHSGLVRDRVMS
jgi:hypothetical protein